MANIQIMDPSMYGFNPINQGLGALGQGIGNRFTPQARDARNRLGDPYIGFNRNTGDWGAGTPQSVQNKYA